MQFYQGHQTNYTYSATGAKLKVIDKTAPEGVILPVTSLNTVLSNPTVSTITTTDYVGNVIYENGTLKRILTPEGYWQDGTYYYFLKDHLGSNRVVINSSGGIAETSSYYPSGMRFGESAVNGGSVQPYRHTGHEMQSMHGLNWIDNGARFRTVNDGGGLPTRDPLCEDDPSVSPYVYCHDNPMKRIDQDGMKDIPLPEVVVVAPKPKNTVVEIHAITIPLYLPMVYSMPFVERLLPAFFIFNRMHQIKIALMQTKKQKILQNRSITRLNKNMTI